MAVSYSRYVAETSVLEFLSDQWFAVAKELVAGRLPPQPDASGRLQFEAHAGDERVRWLQVIDAGEIRRWERGELADAEVEVRWRLEDAWRVLHRELSPNDAVKATTVLDHREGRSYLGIAPPLDLAEQPELDEFPLIPGVTVSFQAELHGSPFGDVSLALRFRDGRVASTTSTVPNPDVRAAFSFRDLIRMRLGEITILDALASGSLDGDQSSMIMMAGLLESESYRRAQRACGSRGSLALAALGEVATTPGYRSAMAELALGTGRPVPCAAP